MSEDEDKPKRRGRPPKKALDAKSKGGRGKVGRPKGDAAIINEYKARMLASPKSEKVLNKVFEVALDDEHKNQAACMKMVMDRVLPTSFFEKDKRDSGIGGVSISISTHSPDSISIDGEAVRTGGEEASDDATDVEFTEVIEGE